jgi:hypothetical protein
MMCAPHTTGRTGDTTMRSFLFLAPFALVACTMPEPGSVYGEDLLPTEDQVKINLPVGSDAAKDEGGTDWADYYVVTRRVTTDVNGLIGLILGTVAYVTTSFEPTWSDTEANQAVWGPWQDSGLDPVSTGVWVQAMDDGSHEWAIFLVPNGGRVEADAGPIVAGVVDPESTREDASGIFVADFETASGMDPAYGLGGQFYVEYDYDAEGVAAIAGFENYGTVQGERVNAVYAYDEDYAGAGSMDLAWLLDVNGQGETEVATLRSRWTEEGAGRGDAKVIGGDLGAEEVTASECWGTDFQRAYYVDSWEINPTEGDVSACAFADAEYPTEASFTIAE